MYWKEATAAFKKHQESRYHYEAVEALLVLPKQVSDIEEVLDKQLKILHSSRPSIKAQYCGGPGGNRQQLYAASAFAKFRSLRDCNMTEEENR